MLLALNPKPKPKIANDIVLNLQTLSFNLQIFCHQDKYSLIIAVSKTPLSTPFYIAKAINVFDDTRVRVKYEQ